MSESGIISFNEFKASSYSLLPPKKDKSGKIAISFRYNSVYPNGFESPIVRTPFGLSHYTKDGADSWSIPISTEAKDPSEQDEVNAFFDQIEELDRQAVQYGLSNATVLFPGKKISNAAVIEALYQPLIKRRDDGSRSITFKVGNMGEKDRADISKILQERISEENEDTNDRDVIKTYLTEREMISEEGEIALPEGNIPNILFYRPSGEEVLIFSYEDLAEAMPEKKSTYGRYIFTLRPWLVGGKFGIKASTYQMEVEEPSKGRPRFNAFSKKNTSTSNEEVEVEDEGAHNSGDEQ